MIEMEKIAIEKIKIKQQQEIEKLLEYEFTRQALEKLNAEKDRLE